VEKLFYASFSTTRFDILKKHWDKHSPELENGAIGTKEPIVNVDLGGILLKVNWQRKQAITSRPIRCPGGIGVWQNLIAVPSMWEHKIYLFDNDFELIRSFTHPYMSDMHSISLTSNETLLVTSTGIDAILEFDFDGALLWEHLTFAMSNYTQC
jgi:hypothetical protein